MNVPFVKMSGAGNDMILVDHRNRFLAGREADFARIACDRKRGVGADAVILLEENHGELSARFLNPDGGEYGLCGNGARCVPVFAAELGYDPSEVRFRTGAGILEAVVVAENAVRVRLPPVQDVELDLEADLDGVPVRLDRGRIADPHAVYWVDDPSVVPVAEWGAKLRAHPAFGAQGTNVSFARVLSPDRVVIRTFERGVEGETLACGSGSTVAAWIARCRGLVGNRVRVDVRSGDRLTVHLPAPEESAAWLEGPVTRSFEGVLRWPPPP